MTRLITPRSGRPMLGAARRRGSVLILVLALLSILLILATTLSFFENIPERHRVGVLAVFNLANSAAVAAGEAIAEAGRAA